MPTGEQVAILYCGTHSLMREIPIARVREFQDAFLDRLRAAHKEVLEALGAGKLDDGLEKVLTETAASVILSMK